MKADDFYRLKSPPIPAVNKRPVCPWCQKPLKVQINYANDEAEFSNIVAQREHIKGEIVSWRYMSYGHFDTLRCGTAYANNAIDENGIDH